MNRLKIILTAISATVLFSQPSAAQTVNQSRTQSVFVELGGPGILFSANYDTRFANKADGIGGRIGAGYVVVGGPSTFTLPIQANYLLGKAGKYFEIGLGATYLRIDDEANKDEFLSFDDTSAILGTMTFGYRYQPVDGGFSFRASLNPVFNRYGFIPYFGGVSFGYSF